jgi:DNA-binding transcriptional ArsR family regulator
MSEFHNHSDNLETLLKDMPSYDDAVIPAELFSILSDPTRIRILWLLCHTTECVLDIGLAINMSSPAVSHHLKLLKSYNIITSKKVGKEMQYTLADNKHAHLIHEMLDKMFDFSCPKTK